MVNSKYSTGTSDVRNEACAWIAQLESGNLTKADAEAFREWLQRSPQHAAQVRALAKLSADLNVLTGMAEPLRAAANHYEEVMPGQRHRNRSFSIFTAGAGVAVGVLIVALVILSQNLDSSLNYEAALITATGEHRDYVLPDGSTIALNTASQISVRYSDEERFVQLIRGEAIFEVASNVDRPFVVRANNTIVEAIGTAFLVRFESELFEVAVTEGSVKVTDLMNITADAPDEAGTPVPAVRTHSVATEPIVLAAGQALSLPVGGSVAMPEFAVVEEISERQLQRKMAWQEGLLDFSDSPLEEVIREVSRHTTLNIEIEDPALRELMFGGVFRTGDTEPLFQALEITYNIQADYIDDEAVRLSRTLSD